MFMYGVLISPTQHMAASTTSDATADETSVTADGAAADTPTTDGEPLLDGRDCVDTADL